MLEECLESQTHFTQECSKRKIELCRTYVESGYCRFGDSCFFAHGIEQLQISQPVLKSKICRNFHKSNQCRYGDRCNFKHESLSNNFSFKYLQCIQEYPQIIMNTVFRKREKVLRQNQTGYFN